MFLHRSLVGCASLLFLLGVLVYAPVAWSGCPDCFQNMQPMNPGHGSGPDGRRKILIRIDDSWGAQTNSAIWNGVTDAVAEWNGPKINTAIRRDIFSNTVKSSNNLKSLFSKVTHKTRTLALR